MLSNKELLMLNLLRQDSRQSLAKISREIDMPVSTVFDKLAKLENNFIKKHTTLIDFGKLGYNIRVNFLLRAASKDNLLSFLQSHRNVNSIYSVQGDFDFYTETVFKDLKSFEEFLEPLSDLDIIKRKEFYVIEDVKREAFLASSQE
tara:strand:+ start:653 stop:1093 length:441 start_codon:yes stop_codon:yes gene_type:complete